MQIPRIKLFISIFSWSYGVLLYEIFSFGEEPYAFLQKNEILDFLNSGARLSQPHCCPVNVFVSVLFRNFIEIFYNSEDIRWNILS